MAPIIIIGSGLAGYSTARALRRLDTAMPLLVITADGGEFYSKPMLSEAFAGSGFQTEHALSAEEGLAAIEQFRPGVLLCDVAMPGEDGYSLIRKVRRLPAERGGSVPAVALTAFGGEENRTRALTAGFQRHMVKPVDIDHLTSAIAELAHRSSPAA